jgi:hypothetical protein
MAGEERCGVIGVEGTVDWLREALGSVPGHILQRELGAVVVKEHVVLAEVDVEGNVV